MAIFLLVVIAIYFIIGYAFRKTKNAEIAISIIGILIPLILMACLL